MSQSITYLTYFIFNLVYEKNFLCPKELLREKDFIGVELLWRDLQINE